MLHHCRCPLAVIKVITSIHRSINIPEHYVNGALEFMFIVLQSTIYFLCDNGKQGK